MSKYVKQSSTGFIVAMIIIGICLFWYGASELDEEYEAPVYISEQFEISPGYTISGKISNRTSHDVHLSSLSVLCSSEKKNNTVATATWTKSDIIVPANGEVTIYESGLSTIGNKNIYFSSISWVSCTISGEKYYLKYSKDGKSFTNTTGAVVLLTIGGILCGFAILIIILGIVHNHKQNSF